MASQLQRLIILVQNGQCTKVSLKCSMYHGLSIRETHNLSLKCSMYHGLPIKETHKVSLKCSMYHGLPMIEAKSKMFNVP